MDKHPDKYDFIGEGTSASDAAYIFDLIQTQLTPIVLDLLEAAERRPGWTKGSIQKELERIRTRHPNVVVYASAEIKQRNSVALAASSVVEREKKKIDRKTPPASAQQFFKPDDKDVDKKPKKRVFDDADNAAIAVQPPKKAKTTTKAGGKRVTKIKPDPDGGEASGAGKADDEPVGGKDGGASGQGKGNDEPVGGKEGEASGAGNGDGTAVDKEGAGPGKVQFVEGDVTSTRIFNASDAPEAVAEAGQQTE